MREIIARLVCFLTVAVVLALAHVFAARHNPPRAGVTTPPILPDTRPAVVGAAPPVVTPPEIERGRHVYGEECCASCHALAGAGNPRNPLDGVGGRRTRAELFEWVTGTGLAADQLSPAVVRRKARYRELAQADLDALMAYLASLTRPPLTPPAKPGASL